MSIDHILIRLNEGGVRKATIEDMRAAGWLPLASLSPTCLDVYREDYKRAKEGFTFTGTAVADIFDRLLTAEYEVGLRGMDLSRCDEEVQRLRAAIAAHREAIKPEVGGCIFGECDRVLWAAAGLPAPAQR